jgi:hypothetical protein
LSCAALFVGDTNRRAAAVRSWVTDQTVRAVVVDFAVSRQAEVALADVPSSTLRVAFAATILAARFTVNPARTGRLGLGALNGRTDVHAWRVRLFFRTASDHQTGAHHPQPTFDHFH